MAVVNYCLGILKNEVCYGKRVVLDLGIAQLAARRLHDVVSHPLELISHLLPCLGVVQLLSQALGVCVDVRLAYRLLLGALGLSLPVIQLLTELCVLRPEVCVAFLPALTLRRRVVRGVRPRTD